MADDEEDILSSLGNFVDKHLRIIRTLTWVVGGVGIAVIVRRTYLLSWFRSVNAIPHDFITKSISLRGEVRGVTPNNILSVMHVPIIKTPSYKAYSSNISSMTNAPVEDLLPVNISGIEFRSGSGVWLEEQLFGTRIQVVPLRINDNTKLDCIVYRKKGFMRRSCVNEELVRQGMAVTGHFAELETHKLYKEMFARLLKAEVRAERKGKGVWTNPSYAERMKGSLASAVQWVKAKLPGKSRTGNHNTGTGTDK